MCTEYQCLDIETNIFWDQRWGWANADDIRERARTQKDARFDCAVVFDAITGQFFSFTRENIEGLISKLSTAKKLVTFNGTVWDLPLLDHFVGKDTVDKQIRNIQHIDLTDTKGFRELKPLFKSLNDSSMEDILKLEERVYEKYLQEHGNDFIAYKLAKAHIDVEMTRKIFDAGVYNT